MYIGALLKLVQSPSEAAVRRALRLISDSVAKASQAGTASTPSEAAAAAPSATTEAAVQLCSLAPVLLQTGELHSAIHHQMGTNVTQTPC